MPDRTALYRRWRPQRFAEVVGQQHVTRTLRNAIAAGQVAHAYLLAGPRGIGKTSIARLIAKAVNCPQSADGEPCDKCAACVSIREGRFLDLIEIDAASNRGIDEMRDLREKVRFTPSEGQFKVYVIDEAHQLTPEAFNALLKTLEEPPAHAIFVLATTESQRIPSTIVSRTQRFDLRRIAHKDMVGHLERIAAAEKMKVEPRALEAIARHAQGSLRDAESILDQLASFSDDGSIGVADVDELLGTSDREEVEALFDAFAADEGAAAVGLVGRLVDEGRDLHLFARRAIEHVRALVLTRYTGRTPDTLAEEASAKLREQAPKFAPDRLARIAKRLVEAEQQLRTGEGTPLPLELAVLELTVSDKKDAGTPPKLETKPAAASTPRSVAAPREGGPGGRAEARSREGATVIGQAAGIEITAVKHAWTVICERTREESIGRAAQLLAAEPLGIEGSTIVVGFADDFARGVWQDRRRPELERDLSSILGCEVRVRCVKQTAPPAVPAATEDPMLRAALETFRRPERILEVE
ncbi:MAG: DNA polymerase III subunit gamma/tau [Chloroflexota bacterium]|nr:DNA polymerase III subunit gamma/tau [Chloroflexota bacterium]